MRTAAVSEIHAQPLGVCAKATGADFGVRVTLRPTSSAIWPCEYSTRLAYEGGRWGSWGRGAYSARTERRQPADAGGARPSRGNIYDVEGQALAYQGSASRIGCHPGRIEDEPGLLAALSQALGQTPDTIKEKYASALRNGMSLVGIVAEQELQQDALAPGPYLSASGPGDAQAAHDAPHSDTTRPPTSSATWGLSRPSSWPTTRLGLHRRRPRSNRRVGDVG